MSDHDKSGREEMERDPMDRAYAEAEAMLDDAQGQAARRARVLAAVAAAPAAAPGGPPARRRPSFGRAGWLIAASVVGVSVLVALQIPSPFPAPQPAAPPQPTAPTPALTPAPRAAPPIASQPPPIGRTAKAEAASAEASASSKAAGQAPAAPPAPSAAPAPPPLPVPPVEHRIEEPRPPAAARALAPTDAGGGEVSEMVVAPAQRRSLREDQAEQLRAAAEAGQADKVAALLAKGAPVDLADEAGDTALMKAVRADHPATAILLRRHGANLDRRNRAGETARDLAAAAGDAELDRALGLKP